MSDNQNNGNLRDLSNCIRFLSIDAVQKANSGHPGMPMGMSDIATILFEKAAREFKGEYMRSDKWSDGDNDKEASFTVLTGTSMPAILSENFFMTNYDNCHKYLLSEEGRDRIARVHFQMIQQVEAEGKV